MLFLQEFIRQRMAEIANTQDYVMHFRHIVLQANQSIELKAGTDIYLLTDVVDDVRVESENGLFDWGNTITNEQVYEHSGDIRIENISSNTNHLPCIQFTYKIK